MSEGLRGRGEGVDVRLHGEPERFELLQRVAVGDKRRSPERHVLDEMRNAGILGRLVERPRAHAKTHADDARRR